MGIVYYLKKDYSIAINHFQKSINIIKKNRLEGLDVTYSNYANCLRETNNFIQAEQYYQKCINLRINKYGIDYYKLAFVYEEYGKLKIKTGAYMQGVDLYKKALKSYFDNFSEKHPYTANMYQIFGDYLHESCYTSVVISMLTNYFFCINPTRVENPRRV